jgi:glycosyltransferase involved in cell wall biosynthesis
MNWEQSISDDVDAGVDGEAPTHGSVSKTVLHTEASLGFGGQEIRILTEGRWLLNHGWCVLLVCQPRSRLMTEAVAQGFPTVGVLMRHALDIRAFLTLRRLMRDRRVDLVHTHSSVDSWLSAVAAKSLRVPVVRSRHVSIPVRRALVYRLADRTIASGEAIRTMLTKSGIPACRVVSIPAGVDTSRFHSGVSGDAVRRELGLSGPAVGLVANVRGSKGHRFFLEAARHVLAGHPGVRFVIVGDGVGFDQVRRQVAAMGLDRDVVMMGFRRDIPEVLSALDVVTLPSTRSEGVSQVILQAMAVGAPVIASTVGGSPEIIEHGHNGLLVPPQDPHALAEAILWVLHDPARARRMAQAGLRRVRRHYTLNTAMKRTTQLYEELLMARRPRVARSGV